ALVLAVVVPLGVAGLSARGAVALRGPMIAAVLLALLVAAAVRVLVLPAVRARRVGRVGLAVLRAVRACARLAGLIAVAVLLALLARAAARVLVLRSALIGIGPGVAVAL